jgi:transposase
MYLCDMRGDLKIRKVPSKSGATSVQVVRYAGGRCYVHEHIGSAHDEKTLAVLLSAADRYVEQNCFQPSLFTTIEPPSQVVDLSKLALVKVTHLYARHALLACARLCGLGALPLMFQDLALMRIIEPTSKLRTIELLEQYFDVSYGQRTVYRHLPALLARKEEIEHIAIDTARQDLGETFNLVLYDVTTLYFESFKEYEFQSTGFSKDNKPQQPQIVIGLITTRSGFPVMHEVFEGKTFEGHTMLEILKRFEQRVGSHCKPVIVADAAMLSAENMDNLNERGYQFIVGARLGNLSKGFIEQINAQTPRTDDATVRFKHTMKKDKIAVTVDVVCQFSTARYKKDKREHDKQINRALLLIDKKEPGRRAKFVKKADAKDSYLLNVELKAKAEKLLGIKGYVTNIPQKDLGNQEVINYYHELWHVEQAFRITKSDLQARPIYHRTEVTIKSHVLICFMALMMSKYLEIKMQVSIKQIRNQLWKIHEAHLRDERTGQTHVLTMNDRELAHQALTDLLKHDLPH